MNLTPPGEPIPLSPPATSPSAHSVLSSSSPSPLQSLWKQEGACATDRSNSIKISRVEGAVSSLLLGSPLPEAYPAPKNILHAKELPIEPANFYLEYKHIRRFVVETSYGVYHPRGWVLISSWATSQEAIEKASEFSQTRVYDNLTGRCFEPISMTSSGETHTPENKNSTCGHVQRHRLSGGKWFCRACYLYSNDGILWGRYDEVTGAVPCRVVPIAVVEPVSIPEVFPGDHGVHIAKMMLQPSEKTARPNLTLEQLQIGTVVKGFENCHAGSHAEDLLLIMSADNHGGLYLYQLGVIGRCANGCGMGVNSRYRLTAEGCLEQLQYVGTLQEAFEKMGWQ